jgi:predicted nucleic acid-binding protein
MNWPAHAPSPVLYVAEPPARYLTQPPLVVDCSAVAGILFQEPWLEQARDRLAGRSLYAPFILQSEICNVALKKARHGATVAAAAGLVQWQDFDIELLRIDVAAAFEIAQRYGLSAYDAGYLWLAAALQCPLATFDDRLAKAANTHLSSLS